MHETWEGSKEAPNELILSIASIADKRDNAEEYDVSSHPKPQMCPSFYKGDFNDDKID